MNSFKSVLSHIFENFKYQWVIFNGICAFAVWVLPRGLGQLQGR
jgi:hypothetical protein